MTCPHTPPTPLTHPQVTLSQNHQHHLIASGFHPAGLQEQAHMHGKSCHATTCSPTLLMHPQVPPYPKPPPPVTPALPLQGPHPARWWGQGETWGRTGQGQAGGATGWEQEQEAGQGKGRWQDRVRAGVGGREWGRVRTARYGNGLLYLFCTFEFYNMIIMPESCVTVTWCMMWHTFNWLTFLWLLLDFQSQWLFNDFTLTFLDCKVTEKSLKVIDFQWLFYDFSLTFSDFSMTL